MKSAKIFNSGSELEWIPGNTGCLHFSIFLKLYKDYQDTQFFIKLTYKKENGEVREIDFWNARYYIAWDFD